MSKNILVVDDEQDMRDYLDTLLQDKGYAVRTAVNGAEALKRVMEQPPDLILLDLQMPEETGTGFYRKLHNHKDLQDIPVIVISGLAGRNIAVSRAVVVLDKPLDEARLLEEMGRVLDPA
jgi:two-component system, cell cycle response regulator DivK